MFSSSRVAISKKITSWRWRHDQNIVSKQQEPNTQAAQRCIPHPHRSETLKPCKFHEISLYFTPKNTGYITEKSRDINLRFWPGMKPINKLALCAKCKHTGLSETNGLPRLCHVQRYFSARRRDGEVRGGAGQSEATRMPITTRQQTTDRKAMSFLFISTNRVNSSTGFIPMQWCHIPDSYKLTSLSPKLGT